MKKIFTISLFVGISSFAFLSGQNTRTPEGVYLPAEGDTLYTGDTDTIAWYLPNANVPYTVSIYLDYKNDAGSWLSYGAIETGVSVTDYEWEYEWDIPSNMPSDEYHVWLYSGTGNVNDYGAEFYVESVVSDTIDITYPVSSTEWSAGSSYPITWNTNLPSTETVSLELYKNGTSVYNIIGSTSNSGSYTFTVPDTVTTSSNFQIYIYHGNGTSNYSDYFTINGAGGSNLCASQIEYVLDGDGLNYIRWSLPIDDGSCDDAGHTGYKIYRDDNPGNPITTFDQTNALGYWETGLTNGTTYCYYVSAVYGADEAPASQSVCGTPMPTPSVNVSGYISYPDNPINFPNGGLNVAVFKNPSSWPPAASDIPIATDNISPVDFTSSVSYTVQVMDPDYPDWNDTYYYIAAKLDEDSDGNDDAGGMYSNDAFTDTDNIEANSYDFSLFSGSGQPTELVNGDTVSGISAIEGEELLYHLEVPAGQDSVWFEIFGGTGDADLYVRHGSYPVANDTDWDCRPYVAGNNEECALAATEGSWYVMIKAFQAVSGLSLVGEYGEVEAGGPLTITVYNPNGGTNWNAGTGETIQWSSTASSSDDYNVDIELWRNNAHDQDIVLNHATGATGGNYYWSIPSSLAAGTDYQIKVRHSDSSVEGTSSPFQISSGGGGGSDDDYSYDFGSVAPARNQAFSFSSSPITVEMFFKLHTIQTSFEWFWIQDLMHLRYESGQIQMGFNDAIDQYFTHSWTTNEWHHIALEYDGSIMRLYIDGSMMQTWNGTQAVQTVSSTTLEVGFNLDGYGDIIRVSNTALYTGSNFNPLTEYWGANASTHLLWHCDEGSGNQLLDESGNGYHGVLDTGGNPPMWSTDTPMSGGGGGSGGKISGNVHLDEDFGFGQVRLGVWLPGSNTNNPPDIGGMPWGEDPPFANRSFEIIDNQISASNGPYTVGGYFDANDNNDYDDGEPTGSAPNIFTDSNAEATGVNITFSSSMGQITGTVSFDTDIITGGDAVVGLFLPDDDETIWSEAVSVQNLGDVSSGNDVNYDFQSSEISDDSGYKIGAFVDYDGDEEPGDIEAYVTVSGILVENGSGLSDIYVEYTSSGTLSTEAAELNMVAITAGSNDRYLGIFNDGDGPILIDEVSTQHGEFSVEYHPEGIGPGSNDFILFNLDFVSAGERTGDLTFTLRNGIESETVVTIPYSIEVCPQVRH